MNQAVSLVIQIQQEYVLPHACKELAFLTFHAFATPNNSFHYFADYGKHYHFFANHVDATNLCNEQTSVICGTRSFTVLFKRNQAS
jgi:hypothetical protein